MLETNTVIHNEALESKWQAREKYWRRKLGRLRLGVEPIEDQLARYNRVTWAITAISTFLGLTFLTLFTVFGRADIGLIFDAIILLPIVGGAWIDHALLANRARRYLAEADEYRRANDLATRSSIVKNTATSDFA